MIIKSDLTVVGGGIAGICAAVTAARHGLKVALLNDRPVLGGNSSSECRVHFSSAASSGNPSYYLRETGVVDELKLHLFHFNPRYRDKKDYDLTDVAFLQFIKNEPNISLFLSTAAYDTVVEDGELKVVKAYNSRTETYYEFESPLFVDASGDAVVSYKAGAEYRMGREGRDEYNEDLAPEVADDHTMGCCFMYTIDKADHPVPFVRPPFAYDYIKDGMLEKVNRPLTGRNLPLSIEQVCSVWWMSYGGLINTIKDEAEIDLELKKLVYGFWDYVKNSGNYPGSENYYINWMAPFPAKRESRRVMGDYLLTQGDIQNHVDFPDQVATGSWPIDAHDVGGIYGNLFTTSWAALKTTYGMPFRMMYSKDIKNLFLAGRIVSATHVAMGSFRVMQTLGAMAQAVGAAAAICKEKGIPPRDLANDKALVKELQDSLQRDGQFLIGIKEDVGLAKDATVSASSYTTPRATEFEKWVDLDKFLMQALPIDGDRFQSVELYIKNASNKESVFSIEISESELPGAYNADKLLKKVDLPVAANFEGWVKVEAPIEEIKNNRVILSFVKNEDIKLAVSTERVMGAPMLIFLTGGIIPDETKKFGDTIKGESGGLVNISYCTLFKNLECAENVYAPKNVTNGWSRPYMGANVWVSEDENPSLTLKWQTAVDINEIHLMHNAAIEDDHFSEPIGSINKDFDIILKTADGEQKIEIRDNYLGLNKIPAKYSGVEEIRIEFLQNYGAPKTELFTVKVF